MSENLEAEYRWPLGEIEPALYKLKSTIGILNHLATSEFEVADHEWRAVGDLLSATHAEIERLWIEAFEQQKAEHQAHREALAEAKKARAVPGSPEDVKYVEWLWGMLIRMVGTIGQAAAKDMAEAPDRSYERRTMAAIYGSAATKGNEEAPV